MKDDTTCLVVDIISADLPILPCTIPKKKQNLLGLLFAKRYLNPLSKATNNSLSAVGLVEELFEEGSAILAERYDGHK